MTVEIAFKKLHDDAQLPTYGTAEAAGADLYAVLYDGIPIHLYPGDRVLVKCGFAMALPAGFEAQIRPRSGLALKNGVTVLNAPGTIDSDYRGEVGVILHNASNLRFVVNQGDRIAQMVIAPVVRARFSAKNELPGTVRGEGGFGSTGTN